MRESIFSRIVTNEDSFTELFVTLCRYRVFRVEIAAFLRNEKKGPLSANWNDFEFDTDEVETQAQTGGERPDIVIRTRNRRYLLVLEVKTSTTTVLTPGQQNGYAGFLDSESEAFENRAVVFMVPRGYGHVQGVNDPTRNVHVAYWEELIDWLQTNELGELNSYIGEFIKLSVTLFGMDVPVIRPADLPLLYDVNSARFCERTVHTVDTVRETAKSAGVAVERASRTQYDYGFFLRDSDGNRVGYFGCAAYHWLEYGQALCVGTRVEFATRALEEHPELVRGQREGGIQYFGIPATSWTEASDKADRFARLLALTCGFPNLGKGLRVELQPEQDDQAAAHTERSLAPIVPGLWSLVDTVRLRLLHSIPAGSEPNGPLSVSQVNSDQDWRWFSVQSEDQARTIRFGWVYGGWWSNYGSPLFVGAQVPALIPPFDSEDDVRDPGDADQDGWFYRSIPRSILNRYVGERDVPDACVRLLCILMDGEAA